MRKGKILVGVFVVICLAICLTQFGGSNTKVENQKNSQTMTQTNQIQNNTGLYEPTNYKNKIDRIFPEFCKIMTKNRIYLYDGGEPGPMYSEITNNIAHGDCMTIYPVNWDGSRKEDKIKFLESAYNIWCELAKRQGVTVNPDTFKIHIISIQSEGYWSKQKGFQEKLYY